MGYCSNPKRSQAVLKAVRRRETSFNYLLWSRGNSGMESCIKSGPSSAARQENNKVMDTIWPLMSNTLGYTAAVSSLAITGGFLPPVFTNVKSAHP